MLSEREKAALLLAEAIAWDPLMADDEVWAKLHEHFTEPEIVELGYFIGLTMGQQKFLKTLGIKHGDLGADSTAGLAPDVAAAFVVTNRRDDHPRDHRRRLRRGGRRGRGAGGFLGRPGAAPAASWPRSSRPCRPTWAIGSRCCKLDVDHNPETTTRYAVSALPTLILFRDGEPVHRIHGLRPKPALRAEIESPPR